MKKKILAFGIVMMLSIMMVLGTVTVIDDFNHPNGEINTSSQNNLGYNFSLNACEYLNGTGHCEGGEGTTIGNTNYFDFESDNLTFSFDIKCSEEECEIYFNNATPTPPNHKIFGISFFEVENPDRIKFDTDFSATTITTALDVTQWLHFDLFINNVTKKVNVTINDVSYGQYDFSTTVGDFTLLSSYWFSNTGSESLYIDNMTIDDGCSPDWICSGYGSCNISDLSPCNDAIDNNACGLPYSGDYSEFSPQSCNYCSADEEITSTTPCQNNNQYVFVIDNNFETCCNITGLVSDCPFGNESMDSYPQSCGVFDYDDNDIPASMVDVIVKFILSIGIFIGIMLFALVGTWAYRKIKTKK